METMALRLTPPQRTQGDGMEKLEHELFVEKTILLSPKEGSPGDDLPVEKADNSCKEPILSKTQLFLKRADTMQHLGTAVKLTPQAVSRKKNKQHPLLILKNKEPKFVPYEPYKAAVKPIISSSRRTRHNKMRNTENKYVKDVVFHNKKLSIDAKIEEISERMLVSSIQDVDKGENQSGWQSKCKAYEAELQTLKEENAQLENQLKFQVQVNGELKNLLVAAIGEDMETKVHVLTEDKLHLAQALLTSAKSLSTHQEQTEWLAGQCEVWRSKFLASSVMVEELARWKASLCQKVNEAHDIMKKLLEEEHRVRENLMRTHENLCLLQDNFYLVKIKSHLSTSNIIDLSEENLNMSQILITQLLGCGKKLGQNQEYYRSLLQDTPAQKLAKHMLANPHLLHLIGEPDAACSAVVGAAVALSGQLYLESHPPRIECCPQCSGEIKLV